MRRLMPIESCAGRVLYWVVRFIEKFLLGPFFYRTHAEPPCTSGYIRIRVRS